MNSLPEYKISDELVPYNQALENMELRVKNISSGTEDELLWFVQHPPLYTAGTSAMEKDLIDPEKFPVFSTGRGGQYTYHGPGQRVVYCMINLKQRNSCDVRQYVNNLEQWIINTLKHFDIDGQRREGRVGIWVQMPDGSEAKIAAIGVRLKKWVSYHGIAINLNPDLSHFNGIVPCGISQYGVTSFADLGINISMQQLDEILLREFVEIF